MATRKKKSNRTRAKSREREANKKGVGKKSPKPVTPKRVTKKKAVSPKRRRNKLGQFVAAPKRRARPKVPPKPRRNKRGQFLPKVRPSPKKRAPRKRKKVVVEIKQPKTTFRKERRKNQKKIPKPPRLERRGNILMRGARGQERSISVQKFWDKVNTGLLLEEVMRVYASLTQYAYGGPPSLYTRFTFTASHVETIMSGGSPKILGIKHGNLKAWFYATGLAYHLPGAEVQLDKALGQIDDIIGDSQNENPNAEFFLEFVTVRAYVVN